jgi:hypothetical protein
MRFFIVCISLFYSVSSNAQTFRSLFSVDSLKMFHETGGKLDSIDLIIGMPSTTFVGGSWNRLENTLGPNELLKFNGGQQFYGFSDWKKMRYTGLPHLGFAYSFGGKGTQFVTATYEQAFKHSILLNLDYTKYRSSGFLRNSEFSHNDLQLQLNKTGKIYSFELKGAYESSDAEQNDGLLLDSLADDFDLIFLPVRKENAKLATRRTRLSLTNYFDFLKDSTIAAGLFTQHELKIKKFSYTEESDSLFLLYASINKDSLITNDQHQWSQIANGVGAFWKNDFHFLTLGSTLRFWNFQNLGIYRDTVELNMVANYTYKRNDLSVRVFSDWNLVGAQNESVHLLSANYKFNTFRFMGSVLYENKLPDYYQRYAVGNNYASNMQNPDKQIRFQPVASVKSSIAGISLLASYSFTQLKNNYFFIQDTWRNDTLSSIRFQQIILRLEYSFRKLTIQPNYIFTVSIDPLKITPTHQFQTRLFLKGYIFKARKMLAYTGVDFALLSSFQRIGYSSNTGAFQLDEISTNNNGYTNLHFFAGFQIEEFKFFLRMENIAYFWNDKNSEIVKKYPLQSNLIRVGITWDFFN